MYVEFATVVEVITVFIVAIVHIALSYSPPHCVGRVQSCPQWDSRFSF